jgi:hypothetical protein
MRFLTTVPYLLWVSVVAGGYAAAQEPAAPVAQALLANLRGLQLPDEPSWWPPAPGWWMLAVVVLLLTGVGMRQLKRGRRAPSVPWQQSALSEHRAISTALQEGTPLNQVLARASVLMRRVALASLPRTQSAAVQDESWLFLLDELGSTDEYSAGVGRLLLTHPYRRHSDLQTTEVDDLLALMHRTILATRERAPDV